MSISTALNHIIEDKKRILMMIREYENQLKIISLFAINEHLADSFLSY